MENQNVISVPENLAIKPTGLLRVSESGRKERPSSSEVSQWLSAITPTFFPALEEYDRVLVTEHPHIAVNRRAEDKFTGYNLCEASAKVLAEAIRWKFNMDTDDILFIEGFVNKDAHLVANQDANDSWLRLQLSDGEFFLPSNLWTI